MMLCNNAIDEDTLHSIFLQFSASYFEDFDFTDDGIASAYYVNSDLYLPLSIESIKAKITDDVCMGEYNKEHRTIYINPEYAQDKRVILHEMIHAYEDTFNNSIVSLRDILTLTLYKKLSAIHPDLEEYLNQRLSRDNFLMVEDVGGAHGALFALKALDIDDRNGWEPGTTFGYDGFIFAREE